MNRQVGWFQPRLPVHWHSHFHGGALAGTAVADAGAVDRFKAVAHVDEAVGSDGRRAVVQALAIVADADDAFVVIELHLQKHLGGVRMLDDVVKDLLGC